MNEKDLEKETNHYQQHVGLAQQYLDSRGITPAIAAAARLGVVQDPLPGHENLVGRMVIPYVTPMGVRDLRFRSLDDMEQPKYLSLPGHSPRLYNTTVLIDDPDVIGITEGEIDALVATHLVGIPSVALPGAQAWTPRRHLRVFKGFRKVVVFADGDEAGRALASNIAKDLKQTLVVDLGDGLDVNSAVLSMGVEEVRRRAGL